MAPRFTPLRLVLGVATLAVAISMLGPVGANAVDDDAGALDMYTADVSGAEASELAAAGFDIADIRDTESGVSLDVVLTEAEAKGLQARGLDVHV
jgi:predicted RNA methylase